MIFVDGNFGLGRIIERRGYIVNDLRVYQVVSNYAAVQKHGMGHTFRLTPLMPARPFAFWKE